MPIRNLTAAAMLVIAALPSQAAAEPWEVTYAAEDADGKQLLDGPSTYAAGY